MDPLEVDPGGSNGVADQIPADERIKEWTKNEIFDLLQTIKVFGSREITQIGENIPTKSTDQIKKAIEYYKEKANVQVDRTVKKKKNPAKKNYSKRPPVPLNSWAKLLQDSLSFNELHTETATALRLIAEFDNIPAAKNTDNIDFRNVYHSIANALEGKAIPDNTPLAAIINKCILDTAMMSRAFMRAGALHNIVDWIDMSDKHIHVLPRPTDNTELATLRHLASQRSYNPLNISEQYLKPS